MHRSCMLYFGVGTQVRIWAWDNPEHNMKIEVFGLGGAVKDLAWGPESKRIVVCGGSGAGMNARAFMWDTGSTIGEVKSCVLCLEKRGLHNPAPADGIKKRRY